MKNVQETKNETILKISKAPGWPMVLMISMILKHVLINNYDFCSSVTGNVWLFNRSAHSAGPQDEGRRAASELRRVTMMVCWQ